MKRYTFIGKVCPYCTQTVMGILAVALLFAAMFAPLFGAAAHVAKWGTRFYCSACGWEGEWEGSKCPRCGN